MQTSMKQHRYSQPFVTDARIEFAVRHAAELAARHRDYSAFDCAEAAVRQVFGRWLLDHTAGVAPASMPLYLRLVDEVEQRLGLHRRRRGGGSPLDPALAGYALAAVDSDLRAIA